MGRRPPTFAQTAGDQTPQLWSVSAQHNGSGPHTQPRHPTCVELHQSWPFVTAYELNLSRWASKLGTKAMGESAKCYIRNTTIELA